MAKVIIKGQKKKKEYGFTYFLFVILSIALIFVGHNIASNGTDTFSQVESIGVERGTVIEIIDQIDQNEEDQADIDFVAKDILFTVKMETGSQKGQQLRALQSLNNYLKVLPKEVQVGD